MDADRPARPLTDRWLAVARAITRVEEGLEVEIPERENPAPVLGITGTGGAGKSSLTDELVLRFLADFPDRTIAILSVDPTKRKTGGALLGDRIRLNSLGSDRVFMRSLATRQAHRALSANIEDSIAVCQAAGFDLIIVESSGIGQADSEIVDISDLSLYVMTPEYGAAMQLEKIDMLDYADFVAINKFDRPKALDALRDVRKQYRRCHELFDGPPDEELPVFGTIASQFHDHGVNALYQGLVRGLAEKFGDQLVARRHRRRARRRAPAPPGDPRRPRRLPARHRPHRARLQELGDRPDQGRGPALPAGRRARHPVGPRRRRLSLRTCGTSSRSSPPPRSPARPQFGRHRRRDPAPRPRARLRLARAASPPGPRSGATTPAESSPTPCAARRSASP